MSIATETRVTTPAVGNGVTTAFPFTFKVFATTDVVVTQTDDDGVESTLVMGGGNDYTVTLNTNQNTSPGGTVTLNAALTTDYLLTITSAVPKTQGVTITNRGGFFPAIINNALDRLTIFAQQLTIKLNRAITIPISDGTSITTELPTKTVRAGKALIFDDDGNVDVTLLVNFGTPVSDYMAATVLTCVSEAAFKAAVNLEIGTDVQAYDAFLTSIAALGTAADRMIYTTGVNTAAELTTTSYGRSLLNAANAAALRTLAGTVVGTDVQAYDAFLLSIATLGTAADRMVYTTGVDTAAEVTTTSFGRSLLNAANAAALRTLAGVGTASLEASGTSGHAFGFLDGANTYSALQTFNSGTNLPVDITWTDATAAIGPICSISRVSATPANSDVIGGIDFYGTTTVQQRAFVRMNTVMSEVTDATRAGYLAINACIAGSFSEIMRIGSGGVIVDGKEDVVQLTVQAHSSQTAKAFVVETSNGTDVFTVTASATAAATNLIGSSSAYHNTDNGTVTGYIGSESTKFRVGSASNHDVEFWRNNGLVGTIGSGGSLNMIGMITGQTGFTTFSNSMADDTAISFTPTHRNGLITVTTSTGNTNNRGLAHYCTGSGAYTTSISAGTVYNFTTGALAGTTSTDAKINVSTHTDNKVYVENRGGGTFTIEGSCLT